MTKSSHIKRFSSALVLGLFLIYPLTTKADPAILYQEDDFATVYSPGLMLDSNGAGGGNTSIQFGNDTISSENGSVLWNITTNHFSVDHALDLTGNLGVNGNISTSGGGSITSSGTTTSTGTLTASNGLTQTTGALNLTATSGALTLSGLSASSISTGANSLNFTSSNFKTTATGINGTAIGATTPSTGAFTSLTSSGLLTASNGFTLTTGPLNMTSTSGALSLTGLSGSTISTGANALSFNSSNFNTTATGINSTAIGATTPSSGVFTNLTSNSSFVANGNATFGDAATDSITFNSEILGASPLNFEGASNNNLYTTFAFTDPTAARVITFPDASGLVSLNTIYQNQNIKNGTRIWNGSATTTGGVATFNPTSDNTGSGTALFTNIYSVQATAQANTGSVTGVPLAAVKLISADKRTITVNAVTGTGVLLGGNTTAFASNGTVVNLTIIGD